MRRRAEQEDVAGFRESRQQIGPLRQDQHALIAMQVEPQPHGRGKVITQPQRAGRRVITDDDGIMSRVDESGNRSVLFVVFVRPRLRLRTQ
jgi:hypothetical protein